MATPTAPIIPMMRAVSLVLDGVVGVRVVTQSLSPRLSHNMVVGLLVNTGFSLAVVMEGDDGVGDGVRGDGMGGDEVVGDEVIGEV